MKSVRIALTALVPALILAGCSTPLERRQASGNYDYLAEQRSNALVVPAGLQQPRLSQTYDIPELGSQADRQLIGQRLDVRPPLQILPLAPGTRLQRGDDHISIVVETVQANTDLQQELRQTVLDFLTDRQIKIASDQGNVVITDWIESDEVLDTGWFTDEIYTLRQRYQFEINVSGHGRSGELGIELIEHEERRNNLAKDIVLTDVDRRRYAIDMLNNAIAFMNVKRNDALALQQPSSAYGLVTSIGIDQDYQPALVAEAEFERVWLRMNDALPALGFEITDKDQSAGTYLARFGPDQSFWDALWGDDNVLPLDEGDYRIRLVALGERTVISVLNAAGGALERDLLDQVYPQISAELEKSR